MGGYDRRRVAAVFFGLMMLTGCRQLGVDTEKLFRSGEVSEIVGFLAGFGMTFAAVPDLLAMLRRRSSEGMNLRMGAIMGVFQMLWIYYGLLITSRPSNHLECHRGADQFHYGWGKCVLPAAGKVPRCGSGLVRHTTQASATIA